MRVSKKFLTATMACVMAASVMTGCSSSTTETTVAATTATPVETTEVATTEAPETEEEVVEVEATTRVVVDHNGTEVEIPTEINRIVICSIYPLPSVYALFDGTGEKLVGMDPSSMAAAENSILPRVAPGITEVSTEFLKDGEINIEELLKLNPDVVFYSADNTAQRELLETAGIPALGFSTSKFAFNAVETYAGWIDLLGDVFQEEEKAAEIVAYGRDLYAEMQTVIDTIPEEEKPRILFLFNYANGVIKTSGSNFFGQFWAEATGAINVASELSGSPEVNMEQIYEWNPDIIYITNFSPYLAEDILENKIEGYDWSVVKAVQEGNVYKFPLGMYRWFPPASDTPLVLQWLAQKNQPELFAELDMSQEIKDYYTRFYNVELTDEDIEQILNPASEASGISK